MMDALSTFHFIRPALLLLLLPALLLWWGQRRLAGRRNPWVAVVAPGLLRHLLIGDERPSRITPNAVLLAAWVLAVLAVAGPTWRREPSPFADAKPPVMVVLETTASMKVADVAPTRLDRARQKLSDLLALREGASTGLIAYAGSAHLVLPPTPDAKVVLAMAQALDPAIMPKAGDALGEAVVLAQRILAEGGRGGSVLVIADGTSQAGLTVPAGTEGEEGRAPVTILAVLPPDRADADDDGLAKAADALGAERIALAVDRSDVRAIAGRLDRAGETGSVPGEGEHWRDAGYWLAFALVPLVLAWFRRGWSLP